MKRITKWTWRIYSLFNSLLDQALNLAPKRSCALTSPWQSYTTDACYNDRTHASHWRFLRLYLRAPVPLCFRQYKCGYTNRIFAMKFPGDIENEKGTTCMCNFPWLFRTCVSVRCMQVKAGKCLFVLYRHICIKWKIPSHWRRMTSRAAYPSDNRNKLFQWQLFSLMRACCRCAIR